MPARNPLRYQRPVGRKEDGSMRWKRQMDDQSVPVAEVRTKLVARIFLARVLRLVSG